MKSHYVLLLVTILLLGGCHKGADIDYTGPVVGWPEPTGAKGGGQYSPLTQIDKNNVSHLQVAWTYDSPDFVQEDRKGVGKDIFFC